MSEHADRHVPHVRIIFNPAARRGHAVRLAHQLGDLAARLDGSAWVETRYARHAVELAAQAAREGAGIVVAMGGDGTVHEVVNGLMQVEAGRRPALGVVPVGSGNDFVVGAGLCADPFDALRRILAPSGARMRPLDLGCVRDNLGRTEHFVNVIGIGLDAAVTYRTQRVRLLRGFPMYAAALVSALAQDYRAPRMHVDLGDGHPISGPILMLAAGNGTREGGGFVVTPKADIGDGSLDVAMIGPVSRRRLLQIIPDVMKGTHERHPEIRVLRARRVTLSAEDELSAHYDGEMMAWPGEQVRRLEIEAVPGALRLAE
jgi:YegS/Rv2252/BmrU family lipid kinase